MQILVPKIEVFKASKRYSIENLGMYSFLQEGRMDRISDKRIMIVGGDSNFLYLMRRYVRRSAFEIISVNLGEDLLGLARKQRPIAIILELDQPETIGWQMLRTLKTDPVSGNIPVIVCSWLDDESHALTEGANSYLRMPILYTDFETALGSILMKE